MNDLFVLAGHNTIVALLLGIFVSGLTRLWRNPPVAHVLWLLVLLKLVAPPIVHLDWPMLRLPGAIHARGPEVADLLRVGRGAVDGPLRVARHPSARTPAFMWVTNRKDHDISTAIGRIWHRARPLLLWVWLGGATLVALVAVARILRFERLLCETLPASDRLQRRVREIADTLGVRRVPDVRYAECALVPLLWCDGRRPTIVLPLRLLSQLDEPSSDLIVAHELAHLRRRDHWVRAVELIVSAVHWWNPLAWLIRREIHQHEELCCDAWVRWAFPDSEKRYAELLLRTAESLSVSPVGAPLLPASSFLRSLSLKARIAMILESRFAPSVSRRAAGVLALLALLVLPLFVQTAGNKAWAGADDEVAAPPARKPAAAPTSELPYAVRFEQGATQFAKDDTITILEVRGTADTFASGNLYWIRGTYTLASRDRATLAASITAMDAENGKNRPLKVQSTVVDRGSGPFTLFLPMPYRGWPHISFYPVDRGSSFGGNYFGTGDSVLKRWWGSEETDKPATPAEFPHAVRFEQGATRFSDGDAITILEVRGTADTFAPGNTYWIKGTYTLASHDRATLAAYITARDIENARGTPRSVQSTVVDRGDGTFTLILPMSCRGWPHVSFYPADGGSDFGGNYFGTGEYVLKRWWGSR